ncbi:MAG: hypothetical protein DPW18_18825 [Chloroflexi bacterium]|nr:hypothetical protein [Chloroflexota bacterium]
MGRAIVKHKTFIVFWAGLAIVTLACGALAPTAAPEQPGVETIVAATLTAIASQTLPDSTQPSGIPVSASGKGFTIPQGLAAGATPISISASLDPQTPIWEIYPAYIEFDLEGYPLQGTFFQPKIFIYPAGEFEQVNEGAAQIIGELRALLANPGAPLPANLPFLPLFNAGQVFHSNEKFLSFQNGSGIRYLTQFGQDISPVNNHSLFYTFQGLTNDGAYYISAILPVNAAFLVEFPSPEYPVPEGGIPFDWENYEAAQAYFDAVTQKLNTTPDDAFSPSIQSLDALIQSLLAQ